jgi:acrylyl-CoA reductase (NADPH)
MDLPTSVAPFILRGVSLLGIDSVMRPKADRQVAWQRLEKELDRGRLADITSEIGLADVLDAAGSIVDGRVRGRIVVKVG